MLKLTDRENEIAEDDQQKERERIGEEERDWNWIDTMQFKNIFYR